MPQRPADPPPDPARARAETEAAVQETLAAAFDGRVPTDSELADKATAKKAYIALLRGLPIPDINACRAVGHAARTVFQWAQDDPEFGQARAGAQVAQRRLRVQVVEDTVYLRIVRGRASPAETIFWLKANGGPRWRNADKRVLTRETVPERSADFAGLTDEELIDIAYGAATGGEE